MRGNVHSLIVLNVGFVPELDAIQMRRRQREDKIRAADAAAAPNPPLKSTKPCTTKKPSSRKQKFVGHSRPRHNAQPPDAQQKLIPQE